jgi:hypothetical protein
MRTLNPTERIDGIDGGATQGREPTRAEGKRGWLDQIPSTTGTNPESAAARSAAWSRSFWAA